MPSYQFDSFEMQKYAKWLLRWINYYGTLMTLI